MSAPLVLHVGLPSTSKVEFIDRFGAVWIVTQKRPGDPRLPRISSLDLRAYDVRLAEHVRVLVAIGGWFAGDEPTWEWPNAPQVVR